MAEPQDSGYEPVEPGLRRLAELVSPLGGLIARTIRLPNPPGEPEMPVFSGRLGDLAELRPGIREAALWRPTRAEFDGAGAVPDPDRALHIALAESLERYATCVYSEEQFVWATAEELGAEALDLDTCPRCSAAELADPACIVVEPDKRLPMRWVRGISLMSGAPRWIPAVMVYLHIPALSIGERFTLPISTGCATHTSVEQALVNGLCEVIERDAIAITWLQRLALPRLELDALGDEVPPGLRHRDDDVQQLYFDATMDLGIPTVYCLDLAPHARKLAQMVSCCTALDPVKAAVKVIRESASTRIGLTAERELPDDPQAFIRVHHGADFMSRPERREAFEFLLDSRERRTLSSLPDRATGDPASDLRALIASLRRAGMEAYAVELTTDEAYDVGFRVVRVVVPALQPLSFAHSARFLGHPRLYEAPERMGHRVRAEADLNPWPQPFA
jgi:ribosomal protein S12 methylthiotransferase accessory factor